MVSALFSSGIFAQHFPVSSGPICIAAPIASQEERSFNQVLFSYKINPQSVLFLGHADNARGSDVFELTQQNRTFFAKPGYAFLLQVQRPARCPQERSLSGIA